MVAIVLQQASKINFLEADASLPSSFLSITALLAVTNLLSSITPVAANQYQQQYYNYNKDNYSNRNNYNQNYNNGYNNNRYNNYNGDDQYSNDVYQMNYYNNDNNNNDDGGNANNYGGNSNYYGDDGSSNKYDDAYANDDDAAAAAADDDGQQQEQEASVDDLTSFEDDLFHWDTSIGFDGVSIMPVSCIN